MDRNTNEHQHKARSESSDMPYTIPAPSLMRSMRSIGVSATGLLRDTVLRPSPATLAAGLSSVVNDGKGEGESSAGPLEAILQVSPTNVRSFHAHEGNGRNQDMQDVSLDEVLGSYGAGAAPQHLTPSGYLASIEGPPEYLEFRDSTSQVPGFIPDQFEEAWNHRGMGRTTIVGDPQGYDDGAAVVTLLSGAGFSADDTPAAVWDPVREEPIALSSVSQENREDESRELRHVDLHLFSGQSSTNVRSLVPDWMHDRGSNLESTSILATTMARADESHICLSSDTESIKAQTKPWLKFLTSYQDEVWGDHLPLIREARKELQDLRNGNREATKEGQPALRRLQMVLGHLGIRPDRNFTSDQ